MKPSADCLLLRLWRCMAGGRPTSVFIASPLLRLSVLWRFPKESSNSMPIGVLQVFFRDGNRPHDSAIFDLTSPFIPPAIFDLSQSENLRVALWLGDHQNEWNTMKSSATGACNICIDKQTCCCLQVAIARSALPATTMNSFERIGLLRVKSHLRIPR